MLEGDHHLLQTGDHRCPQQMKVRMLQVTSSAHLGPRGVSAPEVWSFSQGSRNNNMRTERLRRQIKHHMFNLCHFAYTFPSRHRLINMNMKRWQKMPEMHKHFRLMCSARLHFQSCCVSAYRGRWWQRHLRAIWYTTLPNARGQMKAQCLMETDKECCVSLSLTNVFKFLL